MVSVMSRRPVVLNTDDLDRRSTMPFDVAATRAQFPSLASGIAHFDGTGGTQAPAVVGQRSPERSQGHFPIAASESPANRTPRTRSALSAPH